MSDTNKCAHPMCKCTVSKDGKYGAYCSDHCQEAKSLTEVKCDCKHPECG